jgi:hypothetical protein
MHDRILNTTSDVLVFHFLAHVLIFISYLTWYNTSATSHPLFCIYPPNICHTQQITVKYVQLCPLLIVFSFLSIQSSPPYSLPSKPLYFVFFILLFLFVSFVISNFFILCFSLVSTWCSLFISLNPFLFFLIDSPIPPLKFHFLACEYSE